MEQWIGKKQIITNRLTENMLQQFAVTVHDQQDVSEDQLLGLHYCLCNEALPSDQLGVDSHPQKGGFLPPVDLPRRMWAGGGIEFHAPLPKDQEITKTSVISKIEPKKSRSGDLVFVTVDHEYKSGEKLLIKEAQTIVYRDALAYKHAEAEELPDFTYKQSVTPDATRLFRYSAITFNGHRIHYDSDYARDVEGYPGLVVHGPLIATWLMNLAQKRIPDKKLKSFEFRGNAPSFVGEEITLLIIDDYCAKLQARNSHGALIQTAKAEFEE